MDKQVLDGPVVEGTVCDRKAQAQQRAERIRSHLGSAAEEYAAAIIEEDWRTLGYDSPAAWRAEMFGAQQLTVEARRRVHELLSAEGKTLKEIGAATGTSEATASRDLHPGRTAPGQPGRNEVKRPKPGAQRVREHRERQREAAQGPALQPGTEGSVKEPLEAAKPSPDAQLLSVQARNDQLEAAVRTLEEQNVALQAENAALRAELEEKAAKLGQVQGLLDNELARVGQLEDENLQLQIKADRGGCGCGGAAQDLARVEDGPVPDAWALPAAQPEPERKQWQQVSFEQAMALDMSVGAGEPEPSPDAILGDCAREGCPRFGLRVFLDRKPRGYCCTTCFQELSAANPGRLSRY